MVEKINTEVDRLLLISKLKKKRRFKTGTISLLIEILFIETSMKNKKFRIFYSW